MGISRFKKLAKKTLHAHQLAHSAEKFAERFKGLSIYPQFKENADKLNRQFSTSLKKADREYKKTLQTHQTSNRGFVNWMEKNSFTIINQTNSTVSVSQ